MGLVHPAIASPSSAWPAATGDELVIARFVHCWGDQPSAKPLTHSDGDCVAHKFPAGAVRATKVSGLRPSPFEALQRFRLFDARQDDSTTTRRRRDPNG